MKKIDAENFMLALSALRDQVCKDCSNSDVYEIRKHAHFLLDELDSALYRLEKIYRAGK